MIPENELLALLLGSKARAGILTALLRDRGTELHLGQLARETRLSAPTIKKQLDLLVEGGILTERSSGNRRYVKVPESLPVYEALFQLVRLTSGTHEAIARVVREDSRITLALLFGSVARGEEVSASDIDLLLVGSISLRDSVTLLRSLEVELKRDINPVVYTAAEFRDRIRKKDHFVTRVLASRPVVLKGSLEIA